MIDWHRYERELDPRPIAELVGGPLDGEVRAVHGDPSTLYFPVMPDLTALVSEDPHARIPTTGKLEYERLAPGYYKFVRQS